MRSPNLVATMWLPLLVANQAPVLAQDLAPQQTSIIGTWRLVSQERHYADTGAVIEDQTTDQILGILIYDSAGHMAVQIDRRASNPEYPYTAYYGTYTVDEAGGFVMHHVLTGTVDSYVGTDQRRDFELRDDGHTLIIRSRRPPLEPLLVESVSQLIWQRVD